MVIFIFSEDQLVSKQDQLVSKYAFSADQQDQVSKDEDSEDGEDFSFTAKMKMVLGVCQTVQNSLDLVASYCERVKK